MKRPPMFQLSKSFLLSAIALVIVTGCSYTTPPEIVPLPQTASATRVPKTFFAEIDGNGNITKYKTFLCGWAADKVSGEWGRAILKDVTQVTHCNVQFKIEENFLIGRKVQASLMKDPGQWKEFIRIPIVKHYYYEKARDKYGREKNETIEKERDDWSRRPMMTINPGGIMVSGRYERDYWDKATGTYVFDTEFDYTRNWFGFTVSGEHPRYGARIGSKVRFNFLAFEHDTSFPKTPFAHRNSRHLNILHVLGERINGTGVELFAAHWDTRKKTTIHLQGFPADLIDVGQKVIEEWNNSFEKIGQGRPFVAAVRNAKYNFDLRYPSVTWVQSRYLSAWAPLGIGQANTDVRNGQILWGGVTVWGGMLRRYINAYTPINNMAGSGSMQGQTIGNPFIQTGLVDPMKTMRPMVNAVPDDLVMNTDFDRNRRLLVESWSKQYSDMVGLSIPAARTMSQEQQEWLFQNVAMGGPDRVIYQADSIKMIKAAVEGSTELFEFGSSRTPEMGTINPASHIDEFSMQVARDVVRLGLGMRLNQNADMFDAMGNDLMGHMANEVRRMAIAKDALSQNIGLSSDVYHNAMLQEELIGKPRLENSFSHFPFTGKGQRDSVMGAGGVLSKQDAIDTLNRNVWKAYAGSMPFPNNIGNSDQTDFVSDMSSLDLDRTFGNVAHEWQMGLELLARRNGAVGITSVDKLQALRTVAKDLLLHEVGHMLGIGHNFKENILPKRGMVPDRFLDGEGDNPGFLAQAKDDFKNYSTVMGYKHGLTDILMDYDDLKPGPQDELSLRYLYNREYPLYPVNPRDKDDFKYVSLVNAHNEPIFNGEMFDQAMPSNADGTPDGRPGRVAYFPACNDYDASSNTDPFCNRWDRGYDSITLVENYFETYKGNLTSSLYSFTSVKGSRYWAYEWYLWNKSVRTFSRVRLFYDYMRQTYADELHDMFNVGGADQIQNLLDFSSVCKLDDVSTFPRQSKVTEYFKDPKYKAFKNLCKATGIVMAELDKLVRLPGPDFTKVDYFDRHLTASIYGGEARGSWGKGWGTWKELSRKPIKISALLAMTLPHPFQYWRGWLWPVKRYSRKDGSYLMNTLYPKEFTRVISGTVDANLTLGNSELETRTKMGAAVLSLGYFLQFNYYSNDATNVWRTLP